ncbi:toxin VasX [Marinobacter lacisalsi]|uniref:Toxin VasX n=1 Tax=Marinobacter lacisalsi TaxID=475979 RepID=A0ABV8QD16_9GAMM
MAPKTRPGDDRDSGDLKSWELPATPIDAPATCPLLHTVTLLPLRYGRVETPPAGSVAGMPYSLKSRPLGYRMLRDGFIYIYDEDAGELKEYKYEKNELSGGPMEYPSDHVLYVCFSESDAQWTARKKAQITDNPDERHHWMQRVNLGAGSPLSGGEHLLTVKQARQWVAEFAEDYQPDPMEDGYPEETTPYAWENVPYYHKTRVGKLLKQQNVDDPDDCLCLVMRDDVGVMLDLAGHQDTVVGWLNQWANEENNERNYVLGALIESMTVLTAETLDALLESNQSPAVRALREDLDAMDPETRAETEAAMLDGLNQLDEESLPSPHDQSLPPELRQEIVNIKRTAHPYNYAAVDGPMKAAVGKWYLREALEGADPDFVEHHIDGLYELEQQKRSALRKTLEGDGFGDRGINDLIKRDEMDQFMADQRARLARWQPQLDVITEDRVDMLCSNRLQRATWYFDADDQEQIEKALDLQYACLKDIGRSDEASADILAWMERHPQYTHPLFQTLTIDDQSPDGELLKTYASVTKAGYSVATEAKQWIDKLRSAEAGRLPDLEKLSEDIQLKADAIGDVLSPAVSMGMARSLQKLYDGIGRQSMPELDELFRDLPFFFKKRMLAAIEAGEAEFRFASEAELAAFREDVARMLALRERLSDIRHEYKLAKQHHGHTSAEASAKRAEFSEVRKEHRAIGERVAGALSPVDETSPAIQVEEGAQGRARLSIVAPAAAQEEVGRLVKHFRKGVVTAPKVNLVGDGLGYVVFAAQAVNLWHVSSDFFGDESKREEAALEFFGAVVSTLGAGLMASQGLMDTAYRARAKALADIWQRSTLKTVHIRMGKLHAWLGGFAYAAGAMSSAMVFMGHQAKWQEAVRRGNAGAQVGAVMGMVGSGGLAVSQGYGLYRTVGMGVQVLRAQGKVARGAAWATAGTRLSTLFGRLNMFGLAFTVFELAGTWLYNRYNLDKRDKWLLTVPWSTEPEQIHDGTLEEYEEALASVSSSVDLAHESGENGSKRLTLNCYALPPNALAERLGGESPYRIAIAAWRIQPGLRSKFHIAPETWVPCTDAVLASLELVEGAGSLQLSFTEPEHTRTQYMRRTRDLALMVKSGRRIKEDEFTEDVYMLKLSWGSDNPVTPTDETPQGNVQWRNLSDPTMSLDNL